MRKRETKFLIATCLLGFAAVSLSSSGCGNNGGAAKNPDGSLVAVLYSAAAKTNYVVAMGGNSPSLRPGGRPSGTSREHIVNAAYSGMISDIPDQAKKSTWERSIRGNLLRAGTHGHASSDAAEVNCGHTYPWSSDA